MNENSDQQGQETVNGNTMAPLMTDQERTAVRTLLDGELPPGTTQKEAIDTTFSALAHPGRRYILTYLLRSEGYVTMSDLVDYVVKQSKSSGGDEGFRREITVALTHTHLPALEEEGFVEYNLERQLVVPTEKVRLTAPYLKLALVQQKQLADALTP